MLPEELKTDQLTVEFVSGVVPMLDTVTVGLSTIDNVIWSVPLIPDEPVGPEIVIDEGLADETVKVPSATLGVNGISTEAEPKVILNVYGVLFVRLVLRFIVPPELKTDQLTVEFVSGVVPMLDTVTVGLSTIDNVI